MANKTEPINRPLIYCPYFEGYLDEMPQEAKDQLKAEKPEVWDSIFGEKPTEVTEVVVDPIVTE